jgi:hypothetical protein
MATRATYAFKTNHLGTFTLYGHWDGYPEGAAACFAKMLAYKCADENYARDYEAPNHLNMLGERFLRVNEGMRFTTSHQAHGDTEYRYTVDADGIIKAEKRMRDFVGTKNEWLAIFKGTIAAFVAEYTDETEQAAAPAMAAAAAETSETIQKAVKTAKAAPKATKPAKAAKPGATAAARLAAAMAAALA